MDITAALLNEMFSGFNALFNKAVAATPAPADMPVADLIKRARNILNAAQRTRTDTTPAKELASSYM